MRVDGLLVVVDGPVHRLPAQTKVVALLALVTVVVLTPSGAWPVLAGHGLLVLGTVVAARLPARVVARRMLVETPFVVFALAMPFVADGPRTALGPLTVSEAGVVGGVTLLAKATIGVLAAVVLGATTGSRELLAGLERLRLPAALVAILAFMLRYVVVIAEELRRTEVARLARGGGTGPRTRLAAVAGGVGTRFVRTYERGERVQHAMLARGYTGRMPALAAGGAAGRHWVGTLALPTAALAVLLAGRVLGWT